MPADKWRPFTIEDALSIKAFADRCPIRFSPDGRLLAYSLEHFQAEEGKREETWVVDVDTGEARQVLPEARAAWGPSWAPTGQFLAFYADVGEGLQLWVWDAGTGEVRRVSQAIISADMRFEVPRWTPDGSALICKLAGPARLAAYTPAGEAIDRRKVTLPQAPAGAVTVRCWQSPQAEGLEDGDRLRREVDGWMRGSLVRVDLDSGEALTLIDDVQTRGGVVSPAGAHVALMRFAGRDMSGLSLGFDLCTLPALGGEVRVLDRVSHDYGISFSWSPDSTMLAYRSGADVGVVAIIDARPRILADFGGGKAARLTRCMRGRCGQRTSHLSWLTTKALSGKPRSAAATRLTSCRTAAASGCVMASLRLVEDPLRGRRTAADRSSVRSPTVTNVASRGLTWRGVVYSRCGPPRAGSPTCRGSAWTLLLLAP